MTDAHLRKVVLQYVAELDQRRVSSQQFLTNRLSIQHDALGHVRWMLGEMMGMIGDTDHHYISTSNREKMHRWLGFVQGVLWTERIFTIDHLRTHVRGQELP